MLVTSGYHNLTENIRKEVGGRGYSNANELGTVILAFGRLTDRVSVKTGFLKKEMQEKPQPLENYVKDGGEAPAFTSA
ncbi:MAG: hypothetical protein QXD77_01865 [Candidatus Aenigmatarchaeota archaeon]